MDRCVSANKKETSDAGSQYRCGQVGRGIQPPSTPQRTPNTQTYTKTLVFPLFDSITMTDQRTDQRTNGRTDKASYRVACPQLKIGKMSVLDASFTCVWGWGLDGGWTPLPTHPHHYCDPASLVFLRLSVSAALRLLLFLSRPVSPSEFLGMSSDFSRLTAPA